MGDAFVWIICAWTYAFFFYYIGWSATKIKNFFFFLLRRAIWVWYSRFNLKNAVYDTWSCFETFDIGLSSDDARYIRVELLLLNSLTEFHAIFKVFGIFFVFTLGNNKHLIGSVESDRFEQIFRGEKKIYIRNALI